MIKVFKFHNGRSDHKCGVIYNPKSTQFITGMMELIERNNAKYNQSIKLLKVRQSDDDWKFTLYAKNRDAYQNLICSFLSSFSETISEIHF